MPSCSASSCSIGGETEEQKVESSEQDLGTESQLGLLYSESSGGTVASGRADVGDQDIDASHSFGKLTWNVPLFYFLLYFILGFCAS